jgi:adenylate cyclase
MESFLAYIPTDRRHAMAAGVELPRRTNGAALFADISGFTPLSEALAAALGPARGAEELSLQLNAIYNALIAKVDDFRGSVLTFSGDAITCWFDESGDGGWSILEERQRPTPVQRAAACAIAIQRAMRQFGDVTVAGAPAVSLAVKVAVASGPVVRFIVGDPEIQTIDALAGETLQRLAAAEHLAERGEILIDEASALALAEPQQVVVWRRDDESGQRFAVLGALAADIEADPWPPLDDAMFGENTLRPWLLPPVASRLDADMGEFLTELRPAVSLFLRFGGIDYDDDPNAGTKLDTFIRTVQSTLSRYDANLLQLTIGDKGSYLNAAFGAPIAHEDDAVRAVTAALEFRDQHRQSSHNSSPIDSLPIRGVQIGIAQGRLRTGAYGGFSRRTYGVLGDEVNLAARLMQYAPADSVLVDQSVRRATLDVFAWEEVPPFSVKGKAEPVHASRLVASSDRRTTHLAEANYGLAMVGRKRELEAIVGKLDLVASGSGQVVAVSGEAGSGKSRLVAEVIAQARHRSIVGYGGECRSYGSHASYLVWQNIFRGFFGLRSSMTNDEQITAIARQLHEIDPKLVDRLPLIGAVVNIPIPENALTVSFDAKLRKESLEALIVDCVCARAIEHQVLLVLEDCHYLDPLSHDLLNVIARAVVDLPVMIVVAFRPLQSEWLNVARLSLLDHYTEMPLSDLSDEEIGSLVWAKVRQLYGETSTPGGAFIDELATRAQGNPFYVEQMLSYLKDRNIDPFTPGAINDHEIPDNLYSLILGRIDQLTEDQRTVLKVASVIGRLFEVAMLWGVYHPFSDQQRLLADLAVLSDMDLTALERPEPELTYLFKHVLTQEVAYGTLPYATRATLHEQIGQYVELRHPEFVEQHLDLLAYHFDNSTNIEKRREYLCRAGESARADFANLAAIDYFQRALPLLDGARRANVLLALSEVHDLLGEWEAEERSVIEARTIAVQLNEQEIRARADRSLGILARKRGQYEESKTWLSSALVAFETIGDDAALSHTFAELAEVSRLHGNYDESQIRYAKSLTIADLVEEPVARSEARAHALKGAGTVAIWQGDYPRARELNAESLHIRRELADKPGVAVLLNNQAIVARFENNLDEARRMNNECIAVFRELGDRWSLGQLLNNQACIAADQGDHEEARILLRESLLLRRQLGDRAGLALSLNTLADVMIDEGNFESAVPLLDESLSIYREIGNSSAIVYLIEDYAGVAVAAIQMERAVCLAAFAATRREMLGAPLSPAEAARVARLVEPALAGLDGATVERCVNRGRRLGANDALDDVLAAY